MCEVESHLHKRYEIQKRLGKGAYGIVWRAKSKRSGRVVAIKKIFDAFRNRTDAQRTFREIIFLREFGNHPNIVKLLNVHRADNDKDLYLVFEYMSTDLHRVIKKGNVLKDVHKEFIMYQLLQATGYLHSGNVIHRDQKPSNVLIDSECKCKIADFGLARSLTSSPLEENRECLTDYVATRWYRAPEILIGSQSYTKGVDMWSLGCILGELLTEAPLFPGKSTMDQIELIADFLESSQLSILRKMCNAGADSRSGKISLKYGIGKRKANSLRKYPSSGVDLLKKLLNVSPEKRITAEEALTHPFVFKFYNKKHNLYVSHDVVPPFDDNVQLSVSQYKKKLYDIIKSDKLQKMPI